VLERAAEKTTMGADAVLVFAPLTLRLQSRVHVDTLSHRLSAKFKLGHTMGITCRFLQSYFALG
jgi:hypothetical protein